MGNSPSTRKRGLGRGLGALIRNTETHATDEASAPSTHGVQWLPVDLIQPNPHQPRAHFDEAALAELAASIRTHGVIQPLIVTRNNAAPGYTLVAGERRWRAARLAGLETAPALVREASPSQLLEWALIENIQRADLNPLEEAAAYQALIDEFGLTQDEVAERVGKSRPAVGNAVRLLRLPPPLQATLTTGQLTSDHARTLLALPDPTAMAQAGADVIQRGLNVRQTEALVKQLMAAADEDLTVVDTDPAVDPQISHMENRFRSVLGTRVNLSRNTNGSGRLVIHFYNDADLEELYQLIAGNEPG